MVLTRSDAPRPTLLLRALEARGLSVRLVHDEPGVMALFAERPIGRRIVIVVEPGRWDRLAEMVCAIHTHHRAVLCWQYAEWGDRLPRLTTMDQRVCGPGPSPQVDARASVDADRAAEPVGRIVRRRRALDSIIVKVSGRPLSTREVVTQQELTMLLGPVPGEAG